MTQPTSLADSEKSARRIVILVLLYCIPAFQALLPIIDADIWWHLRTGQWIISNGWVPVQDPFSAYGMGKSWVAYSWLFELFVYGLFKNFGIGGIVAFTVLMSLCIVLAIHFAVHQAGLPFEAEVILVAVTYGSFFPMLAPRPWLFSILFFTAELYILFDVRRTGRLTSAFILPPLFALWANLHIQFIYGLAALVLFVGEGLLCRLFSFDRRNSNLQTISLGCFSLIFLACG